MLGWKSCPLQIQQKKISGNGNLITVSDCGLDSAMVALHINTIPESWD